MQNLHPAPGDEFSLTLAFRQGAVFTAQPDSSQKNLTAVDGLRCTVQANTALAAFNHPVLHLGPSFTSPGLPGLTGTGWEYHTFFADPTAGNKRGFLRAVVDSN